MPNLKRNFHLRTQGLKERLTQLVPEKQEQVKKIRVEHGSKSLGNVTVDMVRWFLFCFT